MAVRRAPATLCPISSPLSPSLTSLFWILFFCSLSFSPFASSYLRCTYFVNEVPLLFRFSSLFLSFLPFFFSSRRFLPRPTDISITTFAFSNFRITILLSAATFRQQAPRTPVFHLSSLRFHPRERFRRIPPRPVVLRSALYWTNCSENNELLSRPTPQNPPLRIRYDTPCSCSENCFSDHLLPLPSFPFNPRSLVFLPRSELSLRQNTLVARTWQPSIRIRTTKSEIKS